ncbi:MAG: response regulator transcription factor [Planctomycetes bacterium]|nr:response regulator transcription factor [Planctomycetota bacterium]
MALGTVLVVEDDPAIRRGVADALRYAGYEVREASNGSDGLRAALGGDIDLLLLDVVLPRQDGFEVLAELRKARSALPVILLTARGTDDDRVRGLRGGADDYVVKPFSAKELLARVEAVLRRSAERPHPIASIRIDSARFDFQRREAALAGGAIVGLSEKECAILQYLAANRSRAVSREELLQRVWGIDPRGVESRTVDMHVARLRQLLGDDGDAPKIIVTVRGKGYMLGGGGAS